VRVPACLPTFLPCPSSPTRPCLTLPALALRPLPLCPHLQIARITLQTLAAASGAAPRAEDLHALVDIVGTAGPALVASAGSAGSSDGILPEEALDLLADAVERVQGLLQASMVRACLLQGTAWLSMILLTCCTAISAA